MHVTESSTLRYFDLTASSTTVDSLLDLEKYPPELQKGLKDLLEYRAHRLWSEAWDETRGDLHDPTAAPTHKIWHEFHKSHELGNKKLTDLESDYTIRQQFYNLRIAESKGLPNSQKLYQTAKEMDTADRSFRDVEVRADMLLHRPCNSFIPPPAVKVVR